jgi:hypothetical protein
MEYIGEIGCYGISFLQGYTFHIMLRDLLTQKFVQKNRLLILDTPEHVDSEKNVIFTL